MFRAQQRKPPQATFRKDSKYEKIIKSRLNPRDKPAPSEEEEEGKEKPRITKVRINKVINRGTGNTIQISSSGNIIVNNHLDLMHADLMHAIENIMQLRIFNTHAKYLNIYHPPKKPEPIKPQNPKTIIVDGVRRTAEGLERFKKNQWLKKMNQDDRLHSLPDDIVQTILEFTGTIENHNDLSLLKLGHHDTYNNTMRALKSYFIRQLVESDNYDFIKYIKSLYDNKNVFTYRYTKDSIERFLHDNDCFNNNSYLNRINFVCGHSRNLDQYIIDAIEWEKETDTIYSTPILSNLMREPCKVFTRKFISTIF